jgi:hypothetical protein
MPLTITHEEAFKFINLTTVKKMAPSIFTSNRAPRTSADYVCHDTPESLEMLRSYNWFPVEAYEVKPKIASNVGFQKHFIRLRNKNFFLGTKDAIEAVPELLLINSYDGRCAARIQTSMSRVCSNTSIFISSVGITTVVIYHSTSKSSKPSITEHLCTPLEDNLKIAEGTVNKFKKVQLTKNMKRKLANECLRARWDYKYTLNDLDQLTYPIRQEDENDDMWTVSNIIQEKLVRGGWTGGGGRLIKPMKDRNRELIINMKLSPILENFYSSTH